MFIIPIFIQAKTALTPLWVWMLWAPEMRSVQIPCELLFSCLFIKKSMVLLIPGLCFFFFSLNQLDNNYRTEKDESR